MSISHVPPDRSQVVITTDRGQREGGYVLVMFGLLLVPLLLMVGLAVDVGSWYNRASDIQKAADAASLAGVVWLPSLDDATTAALETAEKNGFKDGEDQITVSVTKSDKAPRRLKVTIRDGRVGSFFYQAIASQTIDMSRTSYAEYVTPVPMGSPRNFFGTGQLLKDHTATPNDFSSEELFLAINTFCADTKWGDRHQSYYKKRNSNCDGGKTNSDYRETGYEFYIEAKTGRTDDIEVLLWDPRLNHKDKEGSERFIDNSRSGKSEPFTFSLFEADDTPLHDGDNPLICQQTFGRTTPFDGYSYLGSDRWNTLKKSSDSSAADCLITDGMPDGEYILRVTNGGSEHTKLVDASNQWGIVTRYVGAAGDGLCDGRVDATCPRVYGKNAISVRAAADTTAASFFLAEIPPEHVGKTLKLELFDPGEGGKTIEIQQPTGSEAWESVTFDWVGAGQSGTGTTLDVTNDKFNDKLVEITVNLDGYSPPTDNEWWKIYYVFDGDVTDRTTWSARIEGDPVHLIEEN